MQPSVGAHGAPTAARRGGGARTSAPRRLRAAGGRRRPGTRARRSGPRARRRRPDKRRGRGLRRWGKGEGTQGRQPHGAGAGTDGRERGARSVLAQSAHQSAPPPPPFPAGRETSLGHFAHKDGPGHARKALFHHPGRASYGCTHGCGCSSAVGLGGGALAAQHFATLLGCSRWCTAAAERLSRCPKDPRMLSVTSY